MKKTSLKNGDKVTYVDLFHAVVEHASERGITISFPGRGLKAGEKIVKRVSEQWLKRGHNELKH